MDSSPEKTVWIVTGHKGGVGKSVFCLALASVLAMRGEQFGIVEGDGRTRDVFSVFERRVPCRVLDFRQFVPDSTRDVARFEYDARLRGLLHTSDHVIVNTPDGADETLLTWFECTLRLTESEGVKLKMIYMLSDRPDGLGLIDKLAKSFAFFFPVRNLYFAPVEAFALFNSQFASQFTLVTDFPRLRRPEAKRFFDDPVSNWRGGHPYELMLRKNGRGRYALPVLSRARLLRWLIDINEPLGLLIEAEAANKKAIV